jgi:hypothetical protein
VTGLESDPEKTGSMQALLVNIFYENCRHFSSWSQQWEQCWMMKMILMDEVKGSKSALYFQSMS